MSSSIEERAETTARPAKGLAHITELDGVRGLAALAVIVHHVCFTSINPANWAAPVVALWNISRFGQYGVDIFFALSGFLITSLLIQARGQSSYYRDFYWKRALRILPLYLLCLLGVLIFLPGAKSYVLLSLLFVSNFAPLLHIATPGPFWTLAIEEQFYLIWPAVVRRRDVDQVRRFALWIAFTCIGLRIVAACFGHYNFRFTFFDCDGLAFGAVAACWFSRRNAIRSDPGASSLRRPLVLASACGALLFAFSLLMSGVSHRALGLQVAIRQTAVSLLAATLIGYLVTHAGAAHLAWLRSRLLTFFGLISYAMYMVHLYVMLIYDKVFGLPSPGMYLAFSLRLIGILGATVALSLALRYLVELPAASLRMYVLADRPE